MYQRPGKQAPSYQGGGSPSNGGATSHNNTQGNRYPPPPPPPRPAPGAYQNPTNNSQYANNNYAYGQHQQQQPQQYQQNSQYGYAQQGYGQQQQQQQAYQPTPPPPRPAAPQQQSYDYGNPQPAIPTPDSSPERTASAPAPPPPPPAASTKASTTSATSAPVPSASSSSSATSSLMTQRRTAAATNGASGNGNMMGASSYATKPAGYAKPAASYGQPSASAYGYQSSSSSMSQSPSALSSAAAAVSPGSPYQKTGKKQQDIRYEHSGRVMAVTIPAVYAMLFPKPDAMDDMAYGPLATLLCVTVLLWCLDVASYRSFYVVVVWMSVLLLTGSNMWSMLLMTEDDEDSFTVLYVMVQTIVQGFGWAALACWVTLQCRWVLVTTTAASANGAQSNGHSPRRNSNQSNATASGTARSLEWFLHAVTPVTSAAVTTAAIATSIGSSWSKESVALVVPYTFVGSLTLACLLMGTPTSFPQATANANAAASAEKTQGSSKTDASKRPEFAVSQATAFWHSALILLTPASMHLVMFLGRILSLRVTTSEWYDLALAVGIPYLILYGLTVLDRTDVLANPYSNRRLFPLGGGIRGTLIPMLVSLVVSGAAQQRYLVALAQRWAYLFTGTSASPTMTSIYWTVATVAILFATWFGGRTSAQTGKPWMGDYHEDIVQLSLAVAGMGMGRALGLPWNFTPLPILSFLGLSLWLSTRLLRYLTIFLFVVHATGLVVFTFRFAGMDDATMQLPMGYKLNLLRFSMAEVITSVIVGLVAGLAVRSTGGWGYEYLKRFDVTGILLVIYSVMLMAQEISLLKRPVPMAELVGAEGLLNAVESSDDDSMLYSHAWALITSAILFGVGVFAKKVKVLSSRSSSAVVALSIGKATAIYIDSVAQQELEVESTSTVFIRALCASLLCAVMFAPRAFLQPVYLKGGSTGGGAARRGGRELPKGTFRTFLLYAVFFLPAALVVAIPSVLFPLARAIFEDYTYQYNTLPISESMGVTVALWGISCLSMLNFYLPDGGGETYKKLSALAFLMGLGMIFCAPSLGGTRQTAATNPYASVSSVGSQLILRSKSRTGGWGLLSAGLATLLAIAGPLELKARRDSTGRKDRFLLFRCMAFSLMFGGGMAWFFILQSMSETEWVFLLLTALTSMTLAFVGTISSVLGYHVELSEFEEVDQLLLIFVSALCILVPVNGAPLYFMATVQNHPFGSGGWLSTFFSVASMTLFAFAVTVRNRESKNQATKASANLAGLLSWTCAVVVLYGKFGVSGMDSNFDVTTFFGFPAPIIGTLAISPILLVLEGESTGNRKSVKRLSTAAPVPASSFGIRLPGLTSSNIFVPMLGGTTFVFILASLYVVLLRGSDILSMIGVTLPTANPELLSVVGGVADSENHDLAELARKTISHSLALATSAKLSSSGFWTKGLTFGPLLHLGGIVATWPSFFLQVSQWWWNHKVSASLAVLALPLNAIPLVLCRGIATLQAAAIMNLIVGSLQVLNLRRSERQSRMQM